jgi:hypothetical protein
MGRVMAGEACGSVNASSGSVSMLNNDGLNIAHEIPLGKHHCGQSHVQPIVGTRASFFSNFHVAFTANVP